MVRRQIRKISGTISYGPMARDFLEISLSIVSSESASSCGGRILGGHRSSLTPEMLEALVFAKDWLFKA